jgi:hypothetical protein
MGREYMGVRLRPQGETAAVREMQKSTGELGHHTRGNPETIQCQL